MIDKGVCDKGFIWTPTNCECECDKSRDIGEYVDYENYKCKKRLVDKLVEECTETVEEVKQAKITSMELHSTELNSTELHPDENEDKHKYSSWTLLIVYFQYFLQLTLELVVVLLIFIGI